MADAREKEQKAWYDNDPYSTAFATKAIEKFQAHQDVLKRSKLYDRMRRSWLTYYSRDKNSDCDTTDIAFAGERGELIILKPARFRRLVNDQLDVVRQTAPDFEPVALNTDAESQAQTQLTLSILDESGRRHHRPEQRVENAEIAALMGEGVIHGRWNPNKGRVAMVDGKGDPVYEGDHEWSVRSPYEVAYDKTSPDPYVPRWKIVLEPENRWDLLKEHEDDGADIRQAVLDADPWSSHFSGEHMFGRDPDPNDDSIGVYHVYVEPCPSCPEGRNGRVLSDRAILTDGPLDEKRAGVFFLHPAKVIFKREGYTNNFGGLPVAEAHSAAISTIASNADAHGLQRLMTPRAGNLDDTDKGAGLTWLYYDHTDANGDKVPEPKMLQVNVFPPELLNLEEMLRGELDTVMGGSPTQRGDNSATKGESGSSKALLYAAAQSVSNAFMAAVLRLDADRATWEIESLKRHATIERTTAIVGKKNEYTVTKWKAEDLSAVDRVNVRNADASRDSFAGRMAVAEMLIPLPVDQREQMQAFIMTGRIETITEDIDIKRLLVERENDTIRDPKQPVPVVLASDQHKEHLAKHFALDMDETIRQNPALQLRNRQHIAQHVECLTPGSPKFDAQTLILTGQTPLGVPDPNAGKPSAPAAGEAPQAPAPTPGGKTGNMPENAKQPVNPATGERTQLPGPPTPAVGGPAVS